MIPTEIDKKALENFEAHAAEFFAAKREEEKRMAEFLNTKRAREEYEQNAERQKQEKTKSMINDLLGKRILAKLKNGYSGGEVSEFKIIEISPSGNWVKIMNMNGHKFWWAIIDISLVEVLKDLKDGKPLE